MDIQEKIEIILKKQEAYRTNGYYMDEEGHSRLYDKTLMHICKTANEWIGTTFEAYFTEIVDKNINLEFYEGLTKPLNERNWIIPYDNRGTCPKRDMIYLRGQLNNDYYIYVHDCVEGTYGKQFEVAVNGGNELYFLPTIKAFTDNLEVGKCYTVNLDSVLEFGRGKKFNYIINEITEDEYLDNVIDAHINTVAY